MLDVKFGFDQVSLDNLATGESVMIPVDSLKPVFDNVKNIKTWLYSHWYPYVEEEVDIETFLTTEEVLRRSRAGENTEDLLLERVTTVETIRWVIERVTDKNCLVLAKANEPQFQEIYQMNVPAEKGFLTRLSKRELSPHDGWLELQEPSIATFLYEFEKTGGPSATVPSNPD
jgi:hypothetical protein